MTQSRFVYVLVLLFACHSRASSDDSRGSSSAKTDSEHKSSATEGQRFGASVKHTVKAGETLWDIARAYDLHVKDITVANHIKAGDESSIREGRSLTIPGATKKRTVEKKTAPAPVSLDTVKGKAGYHTLEQGETLWDISRTYDVNIDTLLKTNRLSESDLHTLRPGQQIVVPGISPARIEKNAKKRAKTKGRGVRHNMASGETVWDLARTYDVSVSEIMAANRLNPKSVTKLREGESIFIPGVSRGKGGRIKRNVTPSQQRATRLGRRLGLGSRSAGGRLIAGRVKPAWIRAAGGRAGHFTGTLRWPVTKGWFTRGFGSGTGGYHQAVDIMGNIGWNVRAAERGIVGYSGNGIRGYGNTVLVIHPGGWVTMYAHNSVNFVVAGQRVSRGTVLAEVGSTGISRGPHVHFELIYEGKQCDPGPLFRPAVRHRNGKTARIERAVWKTEAGKPKAVECYPRRRHPRSRWVKHE